MISRWLKKNKAAIIILLCLTAGWILYVLFGHEFIKEMYEERSFTVLNRIISRPTTHSLAYYLDKADITFLRLNVLAVIGLFFALFGRSLYFRKTRIKKWFLLLLIFFSLIQTSLFINFKQIDALLVNDDHPKYYSMTVENAHLLMEHATPFGFNHNFQGGIPTFYLRSCFWQLIPFSFFLGDRVGYQVMLIFFIVLLPISLFFLTLELTKREDIAQFFSLVSTFQLGLWHYLGFGMTPAIVALPLSFLSLLFFLKYLCRKNYLLFPLLLFSGVLAYTHLAIFALTWMFFVMIFAYRSITQKKFFANFKKLICLGLLDLIICLPINYNLLHYASFLRTDWIYFEEQTLGRYILSIFLNFKASINPKNVFLLSVLSLLIFYRLTFNPKERSMLRSTLIFSVILLVLQSLGRIPHLEIFILRIGMFTPYIAVFNMSLLLLLRTPKIAKICAIFILLLIVFKHYPLTHRYLRTVNSTAQIDNEINIFVSPGDFLLFENCAHINPTKSGESYDKCEYSHWTGLIQKELNVKFFSHIGEDAHPYNNLRHMYITNGLYRGEPLSQDNEKEFMLLLQDWGVNKICVWSPTAQRFFDDNNCFEFLGQSKKYIYYRAIYEILPEVRLSKRGVGRISDETPFSFTVHLENISENQTVTINKNYFDFWSARDEKGNRVLLRDNNQKICFDIVNNGDVLFEYRKNILLNLIALVPLILALISDILTKILHKCTFLKC
ncbi:hypothetical protein HQ584_10535 [Patescibacteria group bacterium]|nr:hypothetical protein [Patescibacteria group bacterium]